MTIMLMITMMITMTMKTIKSTILVADMLFLLLLLLLMMMMIMMMVMMMMMMMMMTMMMMMMMMTILLFFISVTELVGPSKRAFAGIAIEYFYSIGYMSIALIGWRMRAWPYIEFAISAPPVIFLAYYW